MFGDVANLNFTETTQGNGTLRFGMSDAPDTAWGYYPSSDSKAVGGDVWFNKDDYNSPQYGNYAWMTIIHEIGHALGLKHGHEADGGFPALPASHNSVEYSVMTYAAYVGDPLTTGYAIEQTSYPTTLMMDDIAALQYMYGADFTTNSGNTVYSWSPTTGRESINGVAQTMPAGNHILMTTWDGGGIDTYDLSNYSTNLKIDLRPGAWSTFSTGQLSHLDQYTTNTHIAAGNVANALLYQNDLRSLIENATGGSGSDTFYGNSGNNDVRGGSGIDFMYFSGARSSYTLTDLGTGHVRVVGLDGTDTLSSVEKLVFTDQTVTWNTVAPATPDDFNGDGQSDQLWQNKSTGDIFNLHMSGGQLASVLKTATLAQASWSFLDTGDFNGDGTSDQLWQNKSTGDIFNLQMSGGQLASVLKTATLAQASWSFLDTGDFNGDGTSDQLWQNKSTGDIFNLQMSGGQLASVLKTATLAQASWSFLDTGDFNGDGTSDQLWQNKSTGDIFNLQMSGGQLASVLKTATLAQASWSFLDTGDFNGDGTSDQLWQNKSTGDIFDLQMSGGQLVSVLKTATLAQASWSFLDTGDFNGDGTSDQLWQNTSTGDVYDLQMSGGQLASFVKIATLSQTDWMHLA
jgi:hypothetical protein